MKCTTITRIMSVSILAALSTTAAASPEFEVARHTAIWPFQLLIALVGFSALSIAFGFLYKRSRARNELNSREEVAQPKTTTTSYNSRKPMRISDTKLRYQQMRTASSSDTQVRMQ